MVIKEFDEGEPRDIPSVTEAFFKQAFSSED